MGRTKRVAIYTRVSTDGQSVENQRRELVATAERHGWTIVAEFSDAGISGAKGRDKRPGFDRMLKAATRREIDMIAAWSVDRLGRSLQDLVGFLGEIRGAGVDLYLHIQGLDTSTPAGRAMFQMLGVFAEFERAMIVSRVHAGLKRARKEGKRLGRPTIDPNKERRIRTALERGDKGILKIAAEQGVGSGTVQRVKAAMAASDAR
jgi:DNA invertase Pin-like site-specific DNA recombinase